MFAAETRFVLFGQVLPVGSIDLQDWTTSTNCDRSPAALRLPTNQDRMGYGLGVGVLRKLGWHPGSAYLGPSGVGGPQTQDPPLSNDTPSRGASLHPRKRRDRRDCPQIVSDSLDGSRHARWESPAAPVRRVVADALTSAAALASPAGTPSRHRPFNVLQRTNLEPWRGTDKGDR